MAADGDLENPQPSSILEDPEDLNLEISMRLAEAANRRDRRGELEIRRLKLHAVVAELEERLAKLQKDAALTAGQKTVHRAYLQHHREKTLLSIQLMQLEEDVADARFEHTVSKTPGAEKQWRRQQEMRQQGAALGGGHATRRRVPLPVTKGPGEEALGKLRHAESEYKDAKAKLDELCKKDSYFESLIGVAVEERKHASRASGQVLPPPEVNPGGGPPSTPEETAESGKARTRQASNGDGNGKLKAKLPPKQCDFGDWMDNAKLTGKQRECFSLVREYVLPVAEVSRRLGISRTAVDKRIAAAEKKINEARANQKRAAKGLHE